jgi:hypothetical protein
MDYQQVLDISFSLCNGAIRIGGSDLRPDFSAKSSMIREAEESMGQRSRDASRAIKIPALRKHDVLPLLDDADDFWPDLPSRDR